MTQNEKEPKENVEPLSREESEYIEHIRKRKGRCPDDKTLVAFHRGQFGDPQRRVLKEHISICGLCQAILRIMRETDRVEEETAPVNSSEGVVIEPNLDQRLSAFLKRRQRREKSNVEVRMGWPGRARRLVLHPAFAYLIVLALLYPAYRGLFPRGKEPVQKPGAQSKTEQAPAAKSQLAFFSMPHLVLEPPPRASSFESVPELRMGRQAPYFSISFFVPIRSAKNLRYDMEIRRREGQVVAAEKDVSSYDGLGNFLILCDRTLFTSGRYRMVVLEIDTSTGKVQKEVEFDFRLKFPG